MSAPSRGVGIVVVSHSRALATAALGLASEMLHGRPVRIELAAGLDETTLGTDAVRVKEAIEAVDGPDGVVVLMDLGSAVLSAELALDLLDDPEARGRILLSPAPIVEGLVVAAVAAAGGATRAEVAAEAQDALLGKRSQLGLPEPREESAAPSGAAASGTFVVSNPHGLHARPAARLVGEAKGLDASVTIANLSTGAGPVPAASLSRVAALGAEQGHELLVSATGPQAKEAVDHILALAQRRFDEPDDDPTVVVPAAATSAAPSRSGPIGVSPGIAIGPVRQLVLPDIDTPRDEVGDPREQWRRVVQAVAVVRRDIESVQALAAREAGETEAEIFDAHLALLADPEILDAVRERVLAGDGAFAAWSETLARVEDDLAGLSDDYQRARAADVRAVADQVRRVLAGAGSPAIAADGVLVARDLTPAQTAALDTARVHGVVLAAGSASSHAAILARSRGIPLVVAAGREVLDLPEGAVLVVDGTTGEVFVDPDAEVLDDYRERAAAFDAQRSRDLAASHDPAVTVDGTAVAVAANLGSAADAATAQAAGADEAGLVRTEFLFLAHDKPPTVKEQEAHYAAIAESLGGRPVTFRTLDVGGDKPLAYLPMPAEANPFLGVRGLRLALDRPELLRDQLTAMCSVARRTPVRIMFPMVSTVAELRAARTVLAEAAGADGLPPGTGIGMMVEVPAAALKIDAFLPEIDFVSIGTNDLTQYTMAAERGNAGVADLSDPLDPAVLRLVDHVCRASEGRVPVAVCGELAADPLAAPVLVGLGVRELSVSPAMVPRVKARVRELDVGSCRRLADQALSLESAGDVRRLAAELDRPSNAR